MDQIVCFGDFFLPTQKIVSAIEVLQDHHAGVVVLANLLQHVLGLLQFLVLGEELLLAGDESC